MGIQAKRLRHQEDSEELIASSGLKMDDINIYMEVGSTEAVLATVEAGMEYP